MFKKVISFVLSVVFSLQTCGLAQAAQFSLAGYLGQGSGAPALDRFRPASLRYFSYEPGSDNFQILLDKADEKDLSDIQVKDKADELMRYFRIGLSLPNDKFWVNLRPDAPEQIIDPALEQTDIGKIMLEADLLLKKDTSSLTSPQTKEGKVYWDKLYKKAGELFGSENITIPTITRPWIVPGEIIVRQSGNSAYIYKAALKVMLEEDYLRGTTINYGFNDPRLKELNEYSTQLIRELIIPQLTKEVNRAKRYAGLRQVYYSLILARWFKQSYHNSGESEHQGVSAPVNENNTLAKLIDSGSLEHLTSREPWSKDTYYQGYKKSFEQGEYNLSETVHTPTGQVIRRYISGGTEFTSSALKVTGQYDTVDSSIVKPTNSKLLNYPSGREIVKSAASALTPKERITIELNEDIVLNEEKLERKIGMGRSIDLSNKALKRNLGGIIHEDILANGRVVSRVFVSMSDLGGGSYFELIAVPTKGIDPSDKYRIFLWDDVHGVILDFYIGKKISVLDASEIYFKFHTDDDWHVLGMHIKDALGISGASSALTLEAATRIVGHKIEDAGLNFEYLNSSFPVKEERWEKEQRKELLFYRFKDGIEFGNVKYNLRLVTDKDKGKRTSWGIFLSEMQRDKMRLHYVINRSSPGKVEFIKTNTEITASRQSLESVLDAIIITVLGDIESLKDITNIAITLLNDVMNYPSGLIAMYTEALAYRNAKTYQMRQLGFAQIGALIDEKVKGGAKKYYDLSGDEFYYIDKMAIDNEKEFFYEIRVMNGDFVDYSNSDKRSLYKKIKLVSIGKEHESLEIRVYDNDEKKVIMPNTIDNQLELRKLNSLSSRGNAENFMVRLYMELGLIAASSALTLEEAGVGILSIIKNNVDASIRGRMRNAENFERFYNEIDAILKEKIIKEEDVVNKLAIAQQSLRGGIFTDELKHQGLNKTSIEFNLNNGDVFTITPYSITDLEEGNTYRYSFKLEYENKEVDVHEIQIVPFKDIKTRIFDKYNIRLEGKGKNPYLDALVYRDDEGEDHISVYYIDSSLLELEVKDLKDLAVKVREALGRKKGASSALTLETLSTALKKSLKNYILLSAGSLYQKNQARGILSRLENSIDLARLNVEKGIPYRFSELKTWVEDYKKVADGRIYLDEAIKIEFSLKLLRQIYALDREDIKKGIKEGIALLALSRATSEVWEKVLLPEEMKDEDYQEVQIKEDLNPVTNFSIGYTVRVIRYYSAGEDMGGSRPVAEVQFRDNAGLLAFWLSSDLGKSLMNKRNSEKFIAVIKYALDEIGKSAVSSAIVNKVAATKDIGAVDFRAMDMLIQPAGSFRGLDFSPTALSSSALEAINLEKDLEGINRMTLGRRRPHPQRLKEYVSACIFKGKIDEKADDFILSMLEVFQLQAEEGIESASQDREAVVLADTRNYVLPRERLAGSNSHSLN